MNPRASMDSQRRQSRGTEMHALVRELTRSAGASPGTAWDTLGSSVATSLSERFRERRPTDAQKKKTQIPTTTPPTPQNPPRTPPPPPSRTRAHPAGGPQTPLHSLPIHWIPYRTTYYREDWGFCRHRQLESLPDDESVHRSPRTWQSHLAELSCPGRRTTDSPLHPRCHPSLSRQPLRHRGSCSWPSISPPPASADGDAVLRDPAVAVERTAKGLTWSAGRRPAVYLQAHARRQGRHRPGSEAAAPQHPTVAGSTALPCRPRQPYRQSSNPRRPGGRSQVPHLCPLGEPQLGVRGLYRADRGQRHPGPRAGDALGAQPIRREPLPPFDCGTSRHSLRSREASGPLAPSCSWPKRA